MNKKHHIDLIEINKYEHSHQIAGSFGKGSNKTLNGVVRYDTRNVRFTVEQNNVIVLKTNSLEIAIEKYNNLP